MVSSIPKFRLISNHYQNKHPTPSHRIKSLFFLQVGWNVEVNIGLCLEFQRQGETLPLPTSDFILQHPIPQPPEVLQSLFYLIHRFYKFFGSVDFSGMYPYGVAFGVLYTSLSARGLVFKNPPDLPSGMRQSLPQGGFLGVLEDPAD